MLCVEIWRYRSSYNTAEERLFFFFHSDSFRSNNDDSPPAVYNKGGTVERHPLPLWKKSALLIGHWDTNYFEKKKKKLELPVGEAMHIAERAEVGAVMGSAIFFFFMKNASRFHFFLSPANLGLPIFELRFLRYRRSCPVLLCNVFRG